MKFLKSLSKYFVMTTGVVSLGVLVGIGAVGVYYKQQAVDLYVKSQNYITKQETRDTLPTIKKTIGDLKTTVPENINLVKKQIDEVIPKVSELKGQIDTLESLVKQLEDQANNNSNIIDTILGSKNVKEEIAKLKEQIKTLKESYNTASSFLNDAQKMVNDQGDNVLEWFKKDGAVDKVDNAVDSAQYYYDKILNFFESTPPSEFEYYYSLTANLLLWIPASILLAGAVGGFLTFLFYKNVDGKLVSRSKSKKELTKHVNYILKKNPEILEDIIKSNT